MGCLGFTVIGGAVIFAITGGVWWLVAGRLPMEFVWCYLWTYFCLVAFFAWIAIDQRVERWRNERERWREEAKATAESVKQILHKLEDIERTIRCRD